MPILKSEPDCYPENLFDKPDEAIPWWACYTRARQEKQLMRTLRKAEIGHYAPIISRRYRSPAGRLRESYLPQFANYVFVYGDEMARYAAVCSGSVSRTIAVTQPALLAAENAGDVKPAAAVLNESDWPWWRGTRRNGHAPANQTPVVKWSRW